MTFDYIRIPFFNKIRQAFNGGAFRFLDICGIDNQEFFPAGIIGNGDTHNVIAGAGVSDAGYRLFERKHFELKPFYFFERQFFEQSAASRSQVMLDRIGEGKEVASGFF